MKIFPVVLLLAAVVYGSSPPEWKISEEDVQITTIHNSLVGDGLFVFEDQVLEPETAYFFRCKAKLLQNPIATLATGIKVFVKAISSNEGPDSWMNVGSANNLRVEDGYVEVGGDFQIPAGYVNGSIFIATTGLSAQLQIDANSIHLTKLSPNSNWETEANKRIEQIRTGEITINFHPSAEYKNETIQITLEQISSAFPIGSVFNTDKLKNRDEANQYQQFFYENFKGGSPKNFLKWKRMEKTEGQIAFRRADMGVDGLENEGLHAKGSSLVSSRGKDVPAWLKAKSANETRESIEKRLQYLAEHYGDRVEQWEVIDQYLHEAWFDEKTGDPALLSWIFSTFHELVPGAQLIMNDKGVFAEGLMTLAYKHQALKLLNDDAPLHALGIQAHFYKPSRVESLMKRLAVLSEAGLPLWLTEFDVEFQGGEDQVSAFETVLRLAFSHPDMEGIVLGGFWDGDSYRKGTALVSGANFQLTELGEVFTRLFSEEWRTKSKTIDCSSSSDCTMTQRAYYGTYNLTATVQDKVIWNRQLKFKPTRDLDVYIVM